MSKKVPLDLKVIPTKAKVIIQSSKVIKNLGKPIPNQIVIKSVSKRVTSVNPQVKNNLDSKIVKPKLNIITTSKAIRKPVVSTMIPSVPSKIVKVINVKKIGKPIPMKDVVTRIVKSNVKRNPGITLGKPMKVISKTPAVTPLVKSKSPVVKPNKVISKTIAVKPIEKSKSTKVNNKVIAKPVVKSLEKSNIIKAVPKKDIIKKTIKAVIKPSPLTNKSLKVGPLAKPKRARNKATIITDIKSKAVDVDVDKSKSTKLDPDKAIEDFLQTYESNTSANKE